MQTNTPPRFRLTGISRVYPVVSLEESASFIENATILWEQNTITWVGATHNAPALQPNETVFDANGAIVTPGWIDCHTHLIWAGSRQNEFRMRLEGKTYLDIANAGGGIMSTVRHVRKASLEQLIELARPRLQRFLSYGVTTLEAKSGYALETASEIRMLQAIAALAKEGPIDIIPTFLGAHTIPAEYKHRRQDYVELVCQEMIPQVVEQQLAESCDIFVEESAFHIHEARKILMCGRDAGLLPRIHADQLSAGGGAELAAEVGAASADHLEEISPQGIRAMSEANVVATLIPGSTFCLRQDRYAPARAMLDAGLTVALATDLNPGTTCSENLAFLGTMACLKLHLLPHEVLHAVTRAAAISLQRSQQIGTIAPGYQADLALFRAPDLDYLFYHYGVSHCAQVFKRGTPVWSNNRGVTPELNPKESQHA